jgi:hypothetical protein
VTRWGLALAISVAAIGHAQNNDCARLELVDDAVISHPQPIPGRLHALKLANISTPEQGKLHKRGEDRGLGGSIQSVELALNAATYHDAALIHSLHTLSGGEGGLEVERDQLAVGRRPLVELA